LKIFSKHENPAYHNERGTYWYRFNLAWLTTLKMQFDMSLEPQNLRGDQALLNVAQLEQLGRAIITLGMALHPHGLVDYEHGVQEDEIIDSMLLSLLSNVC
jgi:hypothetical protein